MKGPIRTLSVATAAASWDSSTRPLESGRQAAAGDGSNSKRNIQEATRKNHPQKIHFPRAHRAAFAIVYVVSRRWIDTLVSIEETSTQVPVIFDRALAAEGLAELITPNESSSFTKDPTRPILLACSDNGPR